MNKRFTCRHSPQRLRKKVIYAGCEGESERAYVALVNSIIDQRCLPVYLKRPTYSTRGLEICSAWWKKQSSGSTGMAQGANLQRKF